MTKNPHAKKRYRRHTNFHLYIPFLRCGFLSERELNKQCHIWLYMEENRFYFLHLWTGMYFPARLWYSPLVANCSFHGPVYFSGIPPQGLPLRLFVVYHSFRKMQEHFIENISLSVRGSWWSYDRGNRLRRVLRFLTLLRFLECATLRFNTPSSHELYNIYYE